MKAKQILDWVVRESVNAEFLYFVDVPEEGTEEWDQNEKWWMRFCGGVPPYPVPAGKYLYYFSDQFGAISREDDKVFEPDAEVEFPKDCCCIYLYHMEE